MAPVTLVDIVVESLGRIFLTQLEAHLFLDPEIPFAALVATPINTIAQSAKCGYFVRGLNQIRLQNLPEYTDLRLNARLYVEAIDSSRKVRDVNLATVLDVLKTAILTGQKIQSKIALERILSVPFRQKGLGWRSEWSVHRQPTDQRREPRDRFPIEGKWTS